MILGTEDVAKLSDKQLFEELKKNNLNPGPITGSTRSVYEKKLIKFLTEAKKANSSRRAKTPTRAASTSTTTTPSKASSAVSRSTRYHYDEDEEEEVAALVPDSLPTVTTTERIVTKTTITKQQPKTSSQTESVKSIPKPKLEFKLLKDTRTPEVHRGVAQGDDDDEPIVVEERWAQPMEVNNSNPRSHPRASTRSAEADYDYQSSRPFSSNSNVPSRSFMMTPNLFRTPNQPQSGEYPLNSTVLTYSGSNRESLGGMASASKPKAEPLKNLIKIKPNKLFAESPIESNFNRPYKRIYPDLNAVSNQYGQRSNDNSLYDEPAPPMPSHLQPRQLSNANRFSFLNNIKSDVYKYIVIGLGFFILLWLINSWLTQNDEDPIL